jgi:hypothetical protein
MSTTMTKKRMTEIARQARQYGYFRTDDRNGYVRCPQCRQDVAAYRDMYSSATSTWPKALDSAMLTHLPACTVMVAAQNGEDITGAPLDALSDATSLAPFNSPLERQLDAAYRAAIDAADRAAQAAATA